MGAARLIRRAGPLIAVGVAGAVAARHRRAERARLAATALPPPAPPRNRPRTPRPDPCARASRTDRPRRPPWPRRWTRIPRPRPLQSPESSVTEIVDDLLAPGQSEDRIEDATVVEDTPTDDDR